MKEDRERREWLSRNSQLRRDMPMIACGGARKARQEGVRETDHLESQPIKTKRFKSTNQSLAKNISGDGKQQ